MTMTVLPWSTRALDDAEETMDIRHVQTRGGFVHDVDASDTVQVGRELEALALAAGQGAERLAEAKASPAPPRSGRAGRGGAWAP